MQAGKSLQTGPASQERPAAVGCDRTPDVAHWILPQGSSDFPVFPGNVFGPFLLTSLGLALPHFGELCMEPLLVQKLCVSTKRAARNLIVGVFLVELAQDGESPVGIHQLVSGHVGGVTTQRTLLRTLEWKLCAAQ